MAIAFDANIGVSSQNTNGTSIAHTTIAAAATGARILLFVFYRAAASIAITMSGGGLSGWQFDGEVVDSGNSRRIAFFSVDAPSGLSLGTTLTGSFASAPSASGIIGSASFLGLSGNVVGSGSNSQANGSSWTVSTSGATSAADALAWAVSATNTSTNADDTPSNGIEVHDLTNTGFVGSACSVYEIETTTGVKTIAGARTGLTGSSYNVAGIIAYQAVVPADNTPKPGVAGSFDPELLSQAWF